MRMTLPQNRGSNRVVASAAIRATLRTSSKSTCTIARGKRFSRSGSANLNAFGLSAARLRRWTIGLGRKLQSEHFRTWPIAADGVCRGMSAADAVDGSSTGTTSAIDVGAVRALMIRRSQIMQTITTVGLDIAKSVFQVHCVDADGDVVLRRQLKRRYVLAFFQKLPPCLVGIEACASSHHWSRELQALGHTVRLMPPAYVKPYVKRQKNDAADAEAICEAVTRPNMRFVPTKTPEQQSCLTLHRTTASLHPPADCRHQFNPRAILPSSGSSRRLDAVVSSSCSKLSPMQRTPGSQK